MSGTEISFIIPVYNGEQYIQHCIEMLLKQEGDNFEVVVINDGSTDHTAMIVKQFAEEDRVIYYEQENKGVSAARNKGMEICHGDWIVFCDVDDEIQEGYLRDIKREISIKPNCDCLCYAKDSVGTEDYENDVEDVTHKDSLMMLFNGKGIEYGKDYYLLAVWSKIFRKEFLQQNDLKFNEHVTFGEDAMFMAGVLSKYQSIKFLHRGYYTYVQNMDSAVHSGGRDGDFEGLVEYYNEINTLKRSYSNMWESKELGKMLDRHFIGMGINTIGRVRRGTREWGLLKRSKRIKQISSYILNDIVNQTELTKKEKRRFLFIQKFSWLYILMGDWRKNEKRVRH